MGSCICSHGSHRCTDLEELKSFYFSPQLSFYSCGSHKSHLKYWINNSPVLVLPKMWSITDMEMQSHTQKTFCWMNILLYQEAVQYRCVWYLYVWKCDREKRNVFKHNYSCLNICLGSLKAEKSPHLSPSLSMGNPVNYLFKVKRKYIDITWTFIQRSCWITRHPAAFAQKTYSSLSPPGGRCTTVKWVVFLAFYFAFSIFILWDIQSISTIFGYQLIIYIFFN